MNPERSGAASIFAIVCPLLLCGVVHAQTTTARPLRPFILERWQMNHAMGPGVFLEKISVLEGRADGVTVEKLVKEEGDWITPYRVVSLPDRIIMISDQDQIRTTRFLETSEIEANEDKQARKDCGQGWDSRETLKGHQLNAGVDIQRWQRIEKHPNGDGLRTTRYVSPALGCLDIANRFEESDKGPYKIKFENIIHSLTLSDPPDADFDPAVDYREVPPSVFLIATNNRVALFAKALKTPGACDPSNCSLDLIQKSMNTLLKADKDNENRRLRLSAGSAAEK